MDISVTVPALPGPGATVLGGPAAFAPGGKGANQAVAAARLGTGANVHVRMVGCAGDDDFGRALRRALAAEGVDDRAVRTVPGVPTGIAMITVDEAGENIITVAPGANHEVGAPEIAVISESAGAAAGPARRTFWSSAPKSPSPRSSRLWRRPARCRATRRRQTQESHMTPLALGTPAARAARDG